MPSQRDLIQRIVRAQSLTACLAALADPELESVDLEDDRGFAPLYWTSVHAVTGGFGNAQRLVVDALLARCVVISLVDYSDITTAATEPQTLARSPLAPRNALSTSLYPPSFADSSSMRSDCANRESLMFRVSLFCHRVNKAHTRAQMI